MDALSSSPALLLFWSGGHTLLQFATNTNTKNTNTNIKRTLCQALLLCSSFGAEDTPFSLLFTTFASAAKTREAPCSASRHRSIRHSFRYLLK